MVDIYIPVTVEVDTFRDVEVAVRDFVSVEVYAGMPGAYGTPGPAGPSGLVKADVGLGSVDNTSDASKPVSTAQAAANTTDRARANHTGTQTLDTTTDSATRLAMLAAERTKLTGIATAATANASDASLRDRTTHTGAQAIATVTGLQDAIDGKEPTITKGSLIQGANVTLTGTLTNRLVGAGDVTVAAAAGGGGGGAPAGADRQVQFNNAGAFAGAAMVEIGPNGNLLLVDNATQPAAPASGRAQMYSRLRAGASWPEFQRSTGREIPLQAHFGLNRVAWWAPSSGTLVNTNGIPRTAVGTVATPTLASTNLSTSCRRWRVTSAITAPAAADERAATTVCWRGNAAGLGGWTYTNRISLVTLQATSVGFFGHSSSTAAFATTQTIAALTNCIGIGFTNGTDTNWQIIHNDAAGAPTKIDTGFPLADLTDVYTLVIYSAPNGSSIWVRMVDETSGVAFEQELTTDIPAATTFLSVRNYLNNGGAAASVAYDCSGVYLETDY